MNRAVSFLRSRTFRVIAFTLLAFGSAILGLLLLFDIVLPVLAWLTPAYEHFWFDAGAYGFYRTASYVTLPSNVTVPQGQWERWDGSCDDGGLVMLAPFGAVIGRPGPIILDARGELVWASADHFYASTSTNVNVQEYDGVPYLTFWAGDKHGGEGSGTAYMLDSQYKVHRTVNAVGPGLRTDLHDFSITKDGTALISTINDTRMDLTYLGWGRGSNGPIEDSVLQEIDIETGDLKFQWRASDHFSIEDTHYWNPFGGYDLIDPFDFFHLNTAQKDSKGNILISSRHLHKLLYVDGKTGEIIWTLGGKAEENDFTDLSGGKATDFTWQHHSQIQSEEDGIITVMDNAAAGVFSLHDKPTSHALMIKIDEANRTAELLHSYTIDRRSPSQGSVQVLPSEHVLVGWGPTAAWSEHDNSGDLLCEYHFAASWYFTTQRVKNYRVFKVYNWKSTPDYPPTAMTKGDKVYVSWNGATEVRYWRLQGADHPAADGEYHDLETIGKDGFESAFAIPRDPDYEFLRVVALDADKNVLSRSLPAEEAAGGGSAMGTAFVVFFVVGIGLGVVIVYRMFRRQRRRRESQRGGWEMFDWRRYKYSQLEEEEEQEEREA